MERRGLRRLAGGGGFAWIPDYQYSKIYEVNTSSGALVRTITTPTNPPFCYDGRCNILATNGTTVWVSATGGVYEYSATSGTLLNTIGSLTSANSIVMDASHVWAANYNAGTVSEINPATATVVATINVGTHPGPMADDGTHVWVTNTGSSSITEINAATGAVVGTISSGASPMYVAASDGTNVWVRTTGSSLIQLSATTGSVIQTFPMSYFTNATSLTYVVTDANYVWLEGDDNQGDGMLYKMRP